MSNTNQPPTNYDLLEYKSRGLITLREWSVLRQLYFFAYAYHTYGFKPGRPTKKIARCSLCGNFAAPGLLKFQLRWDDLHGTIEVKLHPDCLERIKKTEATHG
jgi:hypothetical protein